MQTQILSSYPVLSIVIPSYNCGAVVIRCLDSIDYENSEIIIVDDGSIDDTEYKIKSYQKTHSNVHYIKKTNEGVSSARNVGVEHARGKYISFIDADDYIVKGGLKKIVELAEEYDADVVKFRFKNVYNNSKQDTSSVKDDKVNVEIFNGVDVLQKYHVSDYLVWDGIYRKTLIVDNNIRFMNDLSLHEDDVFMGMIYCHANIVVSTDLKIYRYVRSSNFSSTHNQSIQKQRHLIACGIKAINYRSAYVYCFYPQAMDMEKLKYMRWVCSPKMAIEAQLTYKEYNSILNEYKKHDVYPLKYLWIKVAGMDYSLKLYMKRIIQTFFTNHIWIGYNLYKFLSKLR